MTHQRFVVCARISPYDMDRKIFPLKDWGVIFFLRVVDVVVVCV